MRCPAESIVVDSTRACAPYNCRLSCGLDTIAHLLAEELVRSTPALSDAVLDFKSALSAEDPCGREVAEAFFVLRERLENRFYLSVFRLRQWLENHLILKCRHPHSEQVWSFVADARFRTLAQLERRAQQDFYERELAIENPREVSVTFRLVSDERGQELPDTLAASTATV